MPDSTSVMNSAVVAPNMTGEPDSRLWRSSIMTPQFNTTWASESLDTPAFSSRIRILTRSHGQTHVIPRNRPYRNSPGFGLVAIYSRRFSPEVHHISIPVSALISNNYPQSCVAIFGQTKTKEHARAFSY